MARKRPNTCDTCRRRKVKCDGGFPTCSNCSKLRLACEKPSIDHRFLIHTNTPTFCSPALSLPPSSTSEAPAFVSSTVSTELSRLPPREALKDPDIARSFSHFIGTIAPWYDLNDANNTFGTIVPKLAVDFPVLFRSIIALSSSHIFKVTGALSQLTFSFYGACVEDLLEALNNYSNFPGAYLAAACILQLYEILNESKQNPCHLLGAFSFSTAVDVDLLVWDLSQAGYWNYLREEVSIGLFSRRPVRIGKEFIKFRDVITQTSTSDDTRSNLITYILARTINYYIAHTSLPPDTDQNYSSYRDAHIATWSELEADLTLWNANLPSTFDPYSTAPKPGNLFPSEWMLQRWHVSGLQYAAVAEILLALSSPQRLPDQATSLRHIVEGLAIRICGLAFSNENLAATINSFAPLIFCGRYLIRKSHRAALEMMLINFSKPTGYPVEPHIKELQELWAEEDSSTAGEAFRTT
ncbi:hypothetical protein BX600DRAFT_68389 [Xylariales sp. PMI_506]|nr:hypothetical protein BX600DRAFT_68389 [Xylariales sp. PMI_506]